MDRPIFNFLLLPGDAGRDVVSATEVVVIRGVVETTLLYVAIVEMVEVLIGENCENSAELPILESEP